MLQSHCRVAKVSWYHLLHEANDGDYIVVRKAITGVKIILDLPS